MNIKSIILTLSVLLFMTSCQNGASQMGLEKKGLVKVTILYPNEAGKTFDMEYYATTHMPMVASALGDALKGYTIDKGVAAGAPDAIVPYLAIGYLYFDSIEAYQTAFGPHVDKIRGDIPNYTNIKPIIQISEVY